ncbi:SDR family NAD(P)-dependent oxidoreductase [bacterium]|nr:SDR family NAD(P)-dependent oxidoreductase [bacterium]
MEFQTAVAVVGIGSVMPDANNTNQFWQNILNKKYSIGEVPANRWASDLFYHPDPSVPDKTYSKIGGWVHNFPFSPLEWGILIPPRVLDNMDDSQKWAIAASRQALMDYGYPERPLDTERVAVILGNAMAGEHHYKTNLRIHAPEFSKALSNLGAFQALPPEIQQSLLSGILTNIQSTTPPINEDTMPGELSNIIAGRVANVFNFGGANFVTDAACASSFAALQSAVEGLIFHKFDAVLTGGIDRNMGPGSFVKFSKVGALSPDGSRPYAAGANGFVMGEGGAVLLLKRLEDAEQAGDKIYAVIRGIGSSSDGKGKGITAPNPIGQERSIERAWKNAGVNPASVGLIEGHGTSTRVGDRVEAQSLAKVFSNLGLANHSVGLGSVKSNIGHLKSAAGAAGLVKAIYALDQKILPPSANFNAPNPEINFADMPFFIISEQQPWERPTGEIRRAGVSAFGFGGTNFHVVLEEYIPGMLTQNSVITPINNHIETQITPEKASETVMSNSVSPTPQPQFVFLGDTSAQGLKDQLDEILQAAQQGTTPPVKTPAPKDLSQPERLVLSFSSTDDFIKKAQKALSGLEKDANTPWSAFTARGIYRGSGAPGKIAFLFPGQGSQYANMLKDLADAYPIVQETFTEADQIMSPLLGKPLTDYIFTDNETEESIQQMEEALKDTTITQPAVLTANIAILRLLAENHIHPDALIGHSLGEYGALVASNALSFENALEVVSARGHAMAALEVEDNGCMAAVLAPIEEVQKMIETVDGYVVLANVNSPVQSVIGGNVAAVEEAIEKFQAAGMQAVKIPVSHAFHTRIVAPAAEILREMIEKIDLKVPYLPIAANVTGEFYPQTHAEIVDLLSAHIASPVQFVQGIRTLYQSGCRIFIESGPKRVLNSLAKDILKEFEDATVIATNHPRKGGVESFHEALCQCYALGLGAEMPTQQAMAQKSTTETVNIPAAQPKVPTESITAPQPITGSVVVSGAGLGLPGRNKHVFSDDNIERILNGESFIEPLPTATREEMLARKVTRLVKSDAGAQMVVLNDLDQTIKLAGQHGTFDLAEEFGVPADRVAALDITTQLAIAAGIEALRDAGIPLMMHYKQTSTGSYLPDRWMLPPSLADETGVIFGSAFPGLDQLSGEAGRYYQHKQILAQIEDLREILQLTPPGMDLHQTLQNKITQLEAKLQQLNYHFDRKFIFRVLNMGHSQFAEYIGARGPNTALNAACATTTHAISIAEDWIRSGRCKRVVIVAGDDVTGGDLVSWVGTGLLATGATTTEGDLEQAALPFDKRRNGMIMGMGAAGLVIESEDSVRERGMQGIAEILATDTANSAFHGTRLNVNHVSQIMQRLVDVAEKRFGISRSEIASKTMFMSHETYTPARGGSAAAEIEALNSTFGHAAKDILIANTKGFTGHTMGVGIEDVVAVKSLEKGVVPPIANIDNNFEPDPELGNLKLSHGGPVDVQYALRLGAGFGSQVSMSLLRKIPAAIRVHQPTYQQWLSTISAQPQAALELEKRTLRLKDSGRPTQPPIHSDWVYGQGPSQWVQYAPIEEQASQEQPPEPEAVPSHPAPSAPSEEEIKEFLLNLVSEKTGYPTEILEMDLDLEADLGVDTVKQAELFSAVRDHFSIPRREDLTLVDYNTLQKVVGFVQDSLAEEQPTTSAEALTSTAETSQEPIQAAASTQAPNNNQPSEEEIKEFLLNLVSEKTGYPTEILEMDLDLEADLGVDTVKQAELFSAVRDHFSIPRREDLTLVDYNTLQKVVGFVQDSLAEEQPTTSAEALTSTAETSQEPIQAAASTQAPNNNQPSEEEIKEFLLNLVSEKTGYPTEILEMDLDLEADLGVDTVKQAELFSAVRDHFGIPRREDLTLVDYNTLQKVVGFVQDSLAEMGEPASTDEPSAIADRPQAEEKKEQPADQIRRRVPVPMLLPKLDLCRSTGVTINESSRVLIFEDQQDVAGELIQLLSVRQSQILKLGRQDIPNLELTMQNWLEAGKIDGVFFLSPLNPEPELAKMSQETWKNQLEQSAYALYHIMKALPEDAFLITATSTGGYHGYAKETFHNIGFGASGFTKAIKLERPEALVKVVDFYPDESPYEIARHLIEETLRDPAVTEVGWDNGQRFGITVVGQPWEKQSLRNLPADSVILVTGGTGGITLPIVKDLAAHTHGPIFLTGRSPLPEQDNPDLAILHSSGPEGLQQAWTDQLQQSDQKLTPVELRNKLDRFVRAITTLDAIEEIKQTGVEVHYLVADVTNPAQMDKAVQQILESAGKIDLLIHAAGFERSRKLSKKPLDEFAQTIDVKASGFFYLYRSLVSRNALPTEIILFSSVAGRFGNNGQTDYSAANDLLSKMGTRIQQDHPGTRVTTIDWGPWAEIGMASRGSTPRLMAFANIEMLNPKEAASLVYKEITHAGGGEVIFAGKLGILEEQFTAQSGLDPQAANEALRKGDPPHLMLSEITGFDQKDGVTFEVTLDPAEEPFLHDHALNGTPLLPGVMGIEGFAMAAQHIVDVLSSNKPTGYQVSELENVEFTTPFKFYRNEPRHIIWKAFPVRGKRGLEVSVTLESFNPSRLETEPKPIQHFTGTVHLTTRAKNSDNLFVPPPKWNGRYTLSPEEIYRLYFHGPSFRVIDGVQRDQNGLLGRFMGNLPPITTKPLSLGSAPLLIELCLQTAGLWEIAQTGAMSLPRGIQKVRFYQHELNGEPIFAQIQPIPTENGIHFNSRVLDGKGKVYLEIQGYRTSTLPVQMEPGLLAPIQKLVTEE